ncbi:MAG: helicase-related protein, partial [Betaproteobacteria bacterium]
DELLNKPRLIEVARRNTAAETVAQSAYKVPQEAKRALLEHLVKSRNVWQVLCFVRTKHGASRLARQLEKDGLATSAIHGDKTQAARLEALAKFKEGKLQVLVATDVAARGLDIDDLPLVVNYELPHVPEDYIHRIGRTGRAGASGEAISLVAPEEEKYLAEIERLLKNKVVISTAEGFDTTAAASTRERAPRGAPAREARATSPRHAARAGREDTATPPHAGRAKGEPRRREARAATRAPGEETSYGDLRRAEREAAYAKNPDQPIVRRPNGAHADADTARSHPHIHAARRTKPVPVLLQKRKTPETESV